MKFKYLSKLDLLSIIIVFFFFVQGFSQNNQSFTNRVMETLISSGSNSTGSTGTISYSIGQVFYTYIGIQSIYNVAQGIQHQEATINNPIIENIQSKVQVLIYPNPAIDFVNVSLNGINIKPGEQFYQLYDLQGRLIKQNTINQTEIQINLSNLNSSIYVLRVYDGKKVVNIFKIIKQ